MTTNLSKDSDLPELPKPTLYKGGELPYFDAFAMQDYARKAIAAQTVPQPAERQISLSETEAGALRDVIGDSRSITQAVTLKIGGGHSGFGLYAWSTEYPDDGAWFIKPIDAEPTCPRCNGTGDADSGGVMPWGEAVLVTCDCAATVPQVAQSVPKTEAWLIERYNANDQLKTSVVLAPLTDDTFLDESSEAIALCRVESVVTPALAAPCVPVSPLDISIIREAAAIIHAIAPGNEPANMRFPIVDELEGIALMFTASNAGEAAQGEES